MRPGLPSWRSHGCGNDGKRRCDTVNPVSPAFGFAPRPVAPSSRISPARSRRRTRKRRNGRRMIVGLDLHQDVRGLRVRRIAAVRTRIEAAHGGAFHDRRVVGVRDDRTLRARRVRVANHCEQAALLLDPVDDPARVEDLVPAVLGVRLREHHQLDVGRIASHPPEARGEIIDLVRRQRESEGGIRPPDRRGTLREKRNRGERPGREVREQRLRVREARQHRLGHPVVQQRQQSVALRRGKRCPAARCHLISHAAFDAHDRRKAAVLRDVGRLRRPRGNGPRTRDDDEQLATVDGNGIARAISEQALERRLLGGRELRARLRRNASNRPRRKPRRGPVGTPRARHRAWRRGTATARVARAA